MVVDRRPSAARGDHRADLERSGAVAGGQPAGRGADRARSLSFLRPPRPVPATVLPGHDRRLLHVAAADPAQRADRVRGQRGVDRGDAADRPRGQGLAALDHADRDQHSGLRIRQARLRRARGVAVRGIGAAAGNAGDLDGAGAADDAGVAFGDGARFRPDHADADGVGRAVLHRGHADDLGGGPRGRGRRRLIWRLSSGAAGRIKRFVNPASGDTFQVDTAMEAFSNGGWFGLGPGEGIAKRSLPDSHTDFVFAVAAEEFGIILCLTLLALFAFIVIRALSRAYATEDIFARFAASGLAILFGVQAAINMSVNLQLIPAKGMTLPFISYGGSSMVSLA